MKECPQSPSSPAGLIHWLLFVRTFWTFYMNSDSCCAKAGGSVVPHGPWKWCLENITRKLRVDDAILALGSEVLADLREVFCFRGCFGVEFCHWNAPGGNQGAEHGCGVHNGGGAHLQVNREPIKTCEKRLDWKKAAWCAFENSPQGKGHRLPSLFPLWSGCESPGFLQKIPCWASADRCNRSCHTLRAAGRNSTGIELHPS